MQGSGWDRIGIGLAPPNGYTQGSGLLFGGAAASERQQHQQQSFLDDDVELRERGIEAHPAPPEYYGFAAVPPQNPGVLRELTQGIGVAFDQMSAHVYNAPPFTWADHSFASGYIFGRDKMPPRMWVRFEGLPDPDVPVWCAMFLPGRGPAIVFSPRFAFLWHEWRQNIQTFGMTPKAAIGFII